MVILGITLLASGAGLVVLETHVPSLGYLGVPGVAGLVAGSALAVSGLGGGIGLVIAIALLLMVSSMSALALVLRKGGAAHRRRVRTGPEGLVGQLAEVRSWGERGGRVWLEGALWRARHSWPDPDAEVQAQLGEGDYVVVEKVDGLTLGVRCAEDWELVR